MNQEKIFNIATKPYGGKLVNQSHYLNTYKIRSQIFLNFYRKDKKLIKPFPNILFDFVDNGVFNAFALKYQKYYIIGINESVKFILFDLFNRMLSHRDILKEIGNIHDENDNLKIVKDYYSDINSLISKGHDNKYQFNYPVNKIRQNYALHLTTLAIDFIFEHELSHILFGHVDYLYDTFGLNIFSELNLNKKKNIFQLDLQTLEMDADCTALARSCNRAINIVNDPTKVHKDFQEFYLDDYSALSDIYFAVHNTFKVFGDGNYKDTTPGKSSHPDTRIRQLMLHATFEAVTKNNFPYIEIEKLNNTILDRFIESEKAYELITGKKINKEVFQPIYYANHPLPKKLLENWKYNMRDKLLKYTFKTLAD